MKTILLNPGPVNVTPRVRAALNGPDLSHREPEYFELQDAIRAALLRVFDAPQADFTSVIITGSGTAMVEAMGVSSIVIDMAADGGGNCELTKGGEVVEHHGVRVVGLANPPSQMGASASFMYANNVLKLLALFGAKGQLSPDWNDEVVIGVTVARNGDVNHAATAEALGVAHVPIVPDAKENA